MVEVKAQVVGFNRVALEVGDIEEALAFYGRFACRRLHAAAANGLAVIRENYRR